MEELNEFIQAEREWKPPSPKLIRYSKISDEHRQYLNRKNKRKRKRKGRR